ncbi:MAG: glycine zipper domain-containing protein [Gemmataceae bacterium]|nr:glycine zipper domain-containing protein [Gemmataceae bacterium]MDW8264276.1 glycine zipper domain-containing protein [Gemmataceae bacterium]
MAGIRALLLLSTIIAGGCANLSNTEKGAGIGGALGAGTGALIGSTTGHAGAGALIGAGVGALSGALVGNTADKAEKRAAEAQLAAATAPPPLGLTDIVSLAQQHVSDAVIINQIRQTHSVYHLSPNDIAWLKANGVSDAVILEMQATANRLPRRVYSPTPVYAQPIYQPIYIVEPPPPVSIGFGFGYSAGRCGRPCWR